MQIWQHGFLNVFGAGLLALNNPLTETNLVSILADRTGQHLHFDDAGVAWKEWTCPVARIVEIRTHWLTSFGSCSFTEPCEDLLRRG